MSQYLHFFSRKDDVFAPIGTYSANSVLYTELEYAVPYEKITKLDFKTIHDALSHVEELRDEALSMSDQLWGEIAMIERCNNTIAEKVEAIEDLYGRLDEENEVQEELANAAGMLMFFARLIENFEVMEKYEDAPQHKYGLYAGIECGDDVTVEDLDGKADEE